MRGPVCEIAFQERPETTAVDPSARRLLVGFDWVPHHRGGDVVSYRIDGGAVSSTVLVSGRDYHGEVRALALSDDGEEFHIVLVDDDGIIAARGRGDEIMIKQQLPLDQTSRPDEIEDEWRGVYLRMKIVAGEAQVSLATSVPRAWRSSGDGWVEAQIDDEALRDDRIALPRQRSRRLAIEAGQLEVQLDGKTQRYGGPAKVVAAHDLGHSIVIFTERGASVWTVDALAEWLGASRAERKLFRRNSP
jgi:hypothetical protein